MENKWVKLQPICRLVNGLEKTSWRKPFPAQDEQESSDWREWWRAWHRQGAPLVLPSCLVLPGCTCRARNGDSRLAAKTGTPQLAAYSALLGNHSCWRWSPLDRPSGQPRRGVVQDSSGCPGTIPTVKSYAWRKSNRSWAYVTLDRVNLISRFVSQWQENKGATNCCRNQLSKEDGFGLDS